MKKAAFLSAAILAAAVLFGSCGAGRQPDYRIDLAEWRQEDGSYQFGELLWGSSEEEIEESLGILLTKAPGEQEGAETFVSDRNFLWEGQEAELKAEFRDGGLCGISFTFADLEDEIKESLPEALEETFGEPTASIHNNLENTTKWNNPPEHDGWQTGVRYGVYGKAGDDSMVILSLVQAALEE